MCTWGRCYKTSIDVICDGALILISEHPKSLKRLIYFLETLYGFTDTCLIYCKICKKCMIICYIVYVNTCHTKIHITLSFSPPPPPPPPTPVCNLTICPLCTPFAERLKPFVICVLSMKSLEKLYQMHNISCNYLFYISLSSEHCIPRIYHDPPSITKRLTGALRGDVHVRPTVKGR